MQKTPTFSLMWSWECPMAKLGLLHSLTLVQTTVTFHTSSSYPKVFTLLVNSYHYLPSLTKPRPTVSLIRSSTLTFSITKKYLNCSNLKLTPSTCKDMICLSAEIGYIRSTQTSSGIPHVGATRMLAQQEPRSTTPHTFPRLLVAMRLTFFLSQLSQKKLQMRQSLLNTVTMLTSSLQQRLASFPTHKSHTTLICS